VPPITLASLNRPVTQGAHGTSSIAMKRKQIVERIAEERAVPLHTAADWLDSFLHDLIQQLKGVSSAAAAETKLPETRSTTAELEPGESKGRPANPQ
jgi:hypothetical protein